MRPARARVIVASRAKATASASGRASWTASGDELVNEASDYLAICLPKSYDDFSMRRQAAKVRQDVMAPW
jgi:hypothetical protein